jgi:hypothetical protein
MFRVNPFSGSISRFLFTGRVFLFTVRPFLFTVREIQLPFYLKERKFQFSGIPILFPGISIFSWK